ncbi:MAG: hypothetical protein GXY63_03050 [Spirochaetales bacterium]|jgi:hypothetical protein|nr:hypothetical protein [Spirochaetales bacterium]
MIITTRGKRCSRMDRIRGRAPKEERKRKPPYAYPPKSFLSPKTYMGIILEATLEFKRTALHP